MNTEVAKNTPKTSLPTVPVAWGTDDIGFSDMLPSYLKLMQASSDLVKQEKHKAGELVDTTTDEVLGGRGKPVNLIFIDFTKVWFVSEDTSKTGKWEFKETVAVTPVNLNWLKLDTVDGIPVKRDLAIRFFALPKTNLNQIPYIVTFTKSSLRTGQKLLTMMKSFGGSIASYSYVLDSQQQTWDKNTFYVLTVGRDNKTTADEEKAAYKWHQETQKMKNSVVEKADEEVPF